MKILIVKLSALGDIVHCLPAVTQLRNAFPEAQIDWLIERKNSNIIEMSRLAVGILPIDLSSWRDNTGGNPITQIVQFLKKIRAVKYDYAIDFQGLIKSALLTYWSGAPSRIGFSQKALKEPLAALFYTERVTPRRIHIVDQQRELLLPLGVHPSEERGSLFVSEEVHNTIRTKLHDLAGEGGNEGYVLINPGGLWPTKRWPQERFLALAQQLVKKGIPVVITWASKETDVLRDITSHSERGATPARGATPENGIYRMATTLEELVALCAGARLFVGGDTGPLHIAAAMGTPIVALFGPTDSQRNGPLNKEDLVVEQTLPCRPCYKREGCPLGHWKCMEEISVEEVYETCIRRLRTTCP